MVNEQRVLALIQESLDSLHRVGLLKNEVQAGSSTILMGKGSCLDSIAFITFVSDFEDRLDRETGQPIYLILSEIHDFNQSKSSLSAETLARFIASRAEQ